MPFDLDCRDADYRRDPNRPQLQPKTAINGSGTECSRVAERAVRLVGPEREAFIKGTDQPSDCPLRMRTPCV